MASLTPLAEVAAQPDMPEKVYWGCHDSPLGPLLIGITESGYCRLEIASGYGLQYDLGVWKKEWPRAKFIANGAMSAPIAMQFREMKTEGLGLGALALYGNDFQLKMWKALLQLPEGRAISYPDIIQMLKKPLNDKAAGIAAAGAFATLVPCTPVTNPDGSFGGYRWGVAETMAPFEPIPHLRAG